ncbi:MAG: rhomboid family intramembrane serine protease [Planctomycetaceae bacterium]|nr:rhomboid family intramembrane serine protease [Planctomycetaceae bacterium]
MELNRLLLWMAGVSCALNLLYTFRSVGRPQRGWQGILLGLLLTGGIGWLTIPHLVGYIVGSGWLLLVIAPGLLQRFSTRLIARRKYRLALWGARVSSWLHPFDSWRDHPHIVKAMQFLHEGRTDDAKAILHKLGRLDTSVGRMAIMVECQQTGGWERFLTWLQFSYPPNAVMQDESLMMMYLQALGELGQRQAMLDAYQHAVETHHPKDGTTGSLVQIRVAALSGLVPTTELLTDALASTLPDDSQQFWLLTARQVSGQDSTDAFQQLQATASPYLRSMIERRLTSPLPVIAAEELDASARRTMEDLVTSVAHEARYAVMQSGSRQRPYVTWTIAILLIGNFLREVPGGTTDPRNLVDLGALIIPASLAPGEWWRMITAGLLHFGPLHLAMNLLGLIYLGTRLERAWGKLRMTAGYAISTIGAMGFAPYLVGLSDDQPVAILVGASGGVMGLIGALIGHSTVGWIRGRNRRISRQLGLLLLLVCLQTSFDLTTPNVSFACHLLGLLTGLLFALMTGGLEYLVIRFRRADAIT